MTTMTLENQVALVTGAASGIGKAYTKYLLRNGVKVALCDINFEVCKSVAAEFSDTFGPGKTIALQCDVTDQEQFENAFKSCISHFKRLDIVINNAGSFNESMEKWESTMKINYGGVVRGTMLAITYMGTPFGGSGGTVVQTGSITALSPEFYTVPMYKSTKRAVVEYTQTIGDEKCFKHLNVRVMVLCPGYTETSFIEGGSNHFVKDLALSSETVTHPIQTADNCGRALVEVLRRGRTGQCWIVENEEPPRLANLPNVPY